MASKKGKMTLRFNKNKSLSHNYAILEGYITNLDDTFGDILKNNLKENVNEIREKVKNDVNNICNE